MSYKKPTVGQRVIYVSPFGNGEIAGTVVDLFASQFAMETDDGVRTLVLFNEPWRIEE